MKTTLISVLLSLSTMLSAETIIWDGETNNQAWWPLTGDVNGSLPEADFNAAFDSQFANPSAKGMNNSVKCVQFLRSLDGKPWAGAGLTVEGQNLTLAALGNQLSVMILKPMTGNAAIEIQWEGGQAKKLKWVEHANCWQRIIIDFSDVSEADKQKPLKTILVAVHDEDNTTNKLDANKLIYWDNLTIGDDLFNVPIDLHYYSGWNTLNDHYYSEGALIAIGNIFLHSTDLEVGDAAGKNISGAIVCERPVSTNQWVACGVPSFFGTVAQTTFAKGETVNNDPQPSIDYRWMKHNGSTGFETLAAWNEPAVMQTVGDFDRFSIRSANGIAIVWNEEMTLVGDYCLVANPHLQNFNVSAATATAGKPIYQLSADKFVLYEGADEVKVKPFESVLLYNGSESIESLPKEIRIEIPTRVEEARRADGFGVVTLEGGIQLVNAVETVRIYSLQGGEVRTVKPQETAPVALASGVYVVKHGEQAVLVAIGK